MSDEILPTPPQGELAPIDEVPNASSLLNAKILGINNDGSTRLFSISDIKGDYKGIATVATDPGVAVLAQYYKAKPGSYTHFLDIDDQPVVIPADVDGKKVINAYLSFDGTSWSAFFEPVDINLIEYAEKDFVSENLNELFILSKNLFNPEDSNYLEGQVLNDTNGIPYAAGYNTTGFVAVNPGDAIWTSGSSAEQRRVVCFYNIARDYMSGIEFAANGFVIPAGAKFIRASFTQGITNYQVEIGSSATTYEPYDKKLKEDLTPTLPLPDNSISNNKIINKAVSIAKTDFFNHGKNYFNKLSSGNLLGKYMEGTTIYDNPSYNLSDYVKVEPLTNYAPNVPNRVSYFDANKNYLSWENIAGVSEYFTTPANCNYVRCTFSTSPVNFQIEAGTKSTAREDYYLKLQMENVNMVDPSFVFPEVIVAKKLYIPKDEQLNIYYENLLKIKSQSDGKTYIYVSGADVPKLTGRAFKLVPTTVDERDGSISIFDESFNPTSGKAISIISTDPALTTALKILNIGDSYTYNSAWVNNLIAGAGTGLTFLGIRKSHSSTGNVLCEGRGGYSMSDHTTLHKMVDRFSPFMQPSGAYKYFGVTGFWILVNSGSPDYEHGDYATAVKSLFDPATGYLIAPNTNDVVYDNTLALFKYWDGSAWQTISEGTLNFSFNFAKYRTTWGIAQPDVIHFHDGTNTFYSSSETEILASWGAWKTKMDLIISSIHADSPDCKVIVAIPNASGRQGLFGSAVFERANRAYFIHKSKIIQTYDQREAEDIFVLDYYSSIDREFAFANTEEKPFEEYSGTERELYKADPTHLGPDGWTQMGNLYYGIIQSFR
jgi:hypothetical protein